MSTVCYTAAAIALGHAIQIRSGFYAPGALPWLTLALALSAMGAVGPRNAVREWRPVLLALLVFGIMWQLADLARSRPGMYLQTTTLRPFRVAVLAEAGIVALGLWRSRSTRAGWFPVLVAVHAGLGWWLIHASPNPTIDVVTVTNAAWDGLRHGHSPYAITFADIYGEGSKFYAQGAVANGQVQFGYPYPPLTLLLLVPGLLLGDFRYASLAAILATGLLLAYARPSIESRLAGALFLTTPRVLFVLEQGWSEPVSLLLLGVTVFAMVRAPRNAAWAAGLLIASKQYLVVAIPLMRRYRFIAVAVAVAAAVTLPFLIWDPRGFMQDVVLLQAREPFRRDALSYLSWLARQGWGEPSFIWTIAAMLVALAVAAWHRDDSPASLAGSLAFVLLATFAFGRKAFCNYYFFVIGALCCAIAAADVEGSAIMANKRRTIDGAPVRPRP